MLTGSQLGAMPVKVLELLGATSGPISSAAIGENLGCTTKQASSALQTLSSRGLVTPTGQGKAAKWRKVVAFDADISTPAPKHTHAQRVPQTALLAEHYNTARY